MSNTSIPLVDDAFNQTASEIIEAIEATHNPLHIELRDWEVGPNNTIFDNLKAAPSDEDLLWQWGLLVGLSVFALVGILIVFLAILQDPKCKKNSFNVYILFLMVPDILFTGLGIMTTSLNIANGSFFNMTQCHLQSFYSVFTVSASSWLNAILAWQLHSMLKASNQHRRYKAPSRKRAMKHGALVFLWSLFVASWTLWQVDWWPIRTGLYSGAFCLPMAYDETSLAFLFLVFGPCCFVVPFVYICWIVIDILWKRLLPPKEKRKRLLIFFGLIITYFFIWVPTIVLTYILGYWMTSWYTYFGAVWGVSQGFISATVCLLKADIQMACRKFVGCQDSSTVRGMSTTGSGRHGSLGESYIHTTNFGLDTNSMHSMASSVIDLSTHRETSSIRSYGDRSHQQHPPSNLSCSFQTAASSTGKSFSAAVSDGTIPEGDEDEMESNSDTFANDSVPDLFSAAVSDVSIPELDEEMEDDFPHSDTFTNDSVEDDDDNNNNDEETGPQSGSFTIGMDGKVTHTGGSVLSADHMSPKVDENKLVGESSVAHDDDEKKNYKEYNMIAMEEGNNEAMVDDDKVAHT
mmetsp:Transcript_12294/g.29273  ORF Transcript_12294/g.29273 Transcript_12294/m.29273 type:complete len:576 (-) Transcript_12294:386-2113(-)